MRCAGANYIRYITAPEHSNIRLWRAGTSLTPSGTNDAAQSTVEDGIAGQLLGEEPDVASPRKRLRAKSVESPRGKEPHGDAVKRGVGDSGRPPPLAKAEVAEDALVAWYCHHFRMLDKAGAFSKICYKIADFSSKSFDTSPPPSAYALDSTCDACLQHRTWWLGTATTSDCLLKRVLSTHAWKHSDA